MDNLGFDHELECSVQKSTQTEYEATVPSKEVECDVHDESDIKLMYTLTEIPPWYTCILLALQNYLTALGGLLAIPLLLAPVFCLRPGDVGVADLFSTIVFVAGINTLIQATFGARLPLVQGTSYSFLVPTLALLSLPQWQCPNIQDISNQTLYFNESMDAAMEEYSRSLWQPRVREVQGCIMLASLFQVVIGMCGAVGVLLKFIGPLAIGPTITLIGLGLFQPAASACEGQWWIAIVTMICQMVFANFLDKYEIPCCAVTRSTEPGSKVTKSCTKRGGFPVFALFSTMIAVCIMWFICYILTITDTLPSDPGEWGYEARTDSKMQVLYKAQWFRVPYPFQWGLPTFSIAGVFGMLAAVVAGIMESLGDYYATARLCGAPSPPVHVVNRAILMEGIGNVCCGMWGTGSGTTTFTENVGALGITKVASRIVIQVMALLMLLLGVVGKFGALFVTLPQPIIGGVFMVMCGLITAVGMSILQNCKLNSSRNLFIIGFSIFFGLSLPVWISNHPTAIRTGSDVVDQIFTVLLSTSCLVGGSIGLILDNGMPGTREERGIHNMHRSMTGNDSNGSDSSPDVSLTSYDLPWCMRCINHIKCFKYWPVCPTFISNVYRCRRTDMSYELDTVRVNHTDNVAKTDNGQTNDVFVHNF